MGAAKRKRLLYATVKQVQQEGQGCWRLDVVSPSHLAELGVKYLAGDEVAGRLLLLLEGALRSAELPGMLCLLCDYKFSATKRPTSFVLVTAMRDDPSQGIANGLCPTCAALPNLRERVTDKYRQTMIPDLRVLPKAVLCWRLSRAPRLLGSGS
jgi:hypothetical protein